MNCRKLGRTPSQHKTMSRDLTTGLLTNERVVTTEARAKEVHSTVEKMITLGKRGDLHARRQAAALVRNEVASVREGNEDTVTESALQKLFNGITSCYAEHQGGYTRTLKTGSGRDDGAPMIVLELV